MKGIEEYGLSGGGVFWKIHHYADPAKDEAWLERTRLEYIHDPRTYEREILMREIATDGQPVYVAYVDHIHAPSKFHGQKIPLLKEGRLIMGWDCGTASVHPAAVLTMFLKATPERGPMMIALAEFISEPGTSIQDFAPEVMREVSMLYPSIRLSSIIHAGDETARNRQGATGTSNEDIMRDFGIFLELMSNRLQDRINSVQWWLATRSLDNPPTPSFIVCKYLCPTLCKGFDGGYRYPPRKTSTGVIISHQPAKNDYSHPHDALQYACLKAKNVSTGSLSTFSPGIGS